MDRYLIETPRKGKECLDLIKVLNAQDYLWNFDWGSYCSNLCLSPVRSKLPGVKARAPCISVFLTAYSLVKFPRPRAIVEETNMAIKTCISAAEYVRMSTEDQRYSIANQQAAIRTYAATNGFVVIATYKDSGKSGVAIQGREGLRQLLRDVMSGEAPFSSVLVYDVSRWGRFQDTDEAAHYEFLCRSAGVPVHYCAEPFANDGAVANSIMKTLKRMMAGEYSRELGIRVYEGQRRLAKLGFRVVGNAGFGMRRLVVSADGHRRRLLKKGERKAIASDRIILVPGPKGEVEAVRKIFALGAIQTNTPRRIALQLNRDPNTRLLDGRPWNHESVLRILKNEKYMGTSVYGKTSKKLGTLTKRIPSDQWLITPGAFSAIVTAEQFARAQRAIHRRKCTKQSKQFFIMKMKAVLAREGTINDRLLKGTGIYNCEKHFGSRLNAYRLIGYEPSPHTINSTIGAVKMTRLREKLITSLKRFFPGNLRVVRLSGEFRRCVLQFDLRTIVAIDFCRPLKRKVNGEHRWLFKVHDPERPYCHLVCMVDPKLSSLLSCYLMPGPSIERQCKIKIVKANDGWFSAGIKIDRLSDLYRATGTLVGSNEEIDQPITVGDVTVTMRTSTVTVNGKQTILPPLTAEVFRLLLSNAGQVVSRTQLLQLFEQHSASGHNLNLHIFELRTKLGPTVARRIETVRGVGYRYIESTADRLDHSTSSTIRFKRFKDEFGHLLRDEDLRQLSSMFNQSLRMLDS